MPVASTAAIERYGGQPSCRVFAAIIVDSATTEPTDRSMPPVRITKVMPTASTIRKALSISRLSTHLRVGEALVADAADARTSR